MIDEHVRLTKEYYTQAFTEPSFDYIFAYIKVAIVLGLITFGLWYQFGRKQEPNLSINFD